MSTSWPSLLSDLIKGVPAAIVALLVGVIAATVAYRQYKVARTKLKLDLFDKRYAVFEEVWEILRDVVLYSGTRAKSTRGANRPFERLAPKVSFLFGPDVEKYFSTLLDAWEMLKRLELRCRHQPLTPEEVAQALELYRFFQNQASTGAKTIFGRYLSFDGWK